LASLWLSDVQDQVAESEQQEGHHGDHAKSDELIPHDLETSACVTRRSPAH
jgi:hypothetical protein